MRTSIRDVSEISKVPLAGKLQARNVLASDLLVTESSRRFVYSPFIFATDCQALQTPIDFFSQRM